MCLNRRTLLGFGSLLVCRGDESRGRIYFLLFFYRLRSGLRYLSHDFFSFLGFLRFLISGIIYYIPAAFCTIDLTHSLCLDDAILD